MWTKAFWKGAIERGVSTFAQAFGALLAAAGLGLIDAPWLASASAAGMAAFLSLLKSIAALVTTGTISLTGAEIPSGLVVAMEDAKTGEAVAGDAMPTVPTGQPVVVTNAPPG